MNKLINIFQNEKIKTICFYVILFLLCASVAVRSKNYDYDLWARLIAGKAFVQTGQVLKYDFLSYTPTHPWFDHEWGSSIVFYLFQNYLGHIGLLLLQILLFFGTFFILTKIIKLKYENTCGYQNIFIYFVTLHAFSVTYSSLVRCHSFTFLFFIFEIFLLETVRKNLNYKLLLILPPLFIIWGNMHGGVVSGLGILFLYAIGELLNKQNFKPFLFTALVCPLMLFINPYGTDYIVFLFKAIIMARKHVVEWWPIFSRYNYHLFLPFKLFALFCLIVEAIKIKNCFNLKTMDKTKFLVLLVTLFMAIKHVKMMPFFALTATAFCYGDIIKLFKNFVLPKWGNTALTCFLALSSIYILAVKDYRPLVNFSIYPIMEVEFLKVNNISGKLLVNFGLGSYSAYKLYPQNKIYMDGRYEEVYDDYLLEDLNKLYTLNDENLTLFVKNKPEIIILEKGYKKFYAYLLKDTKHWALAFEGIKYGVFLDKKILEKEYYPPNGDLKYYKKTIFNTNIKFKGKDSIDINEINNRGKQIDK